MTDREGVTIRRQDELERTGNWLLARRSLGLSAFGMNVVEIPPGERIPEHDETGRDQEEVFVFLGGDAALVVEGEEIPVTAGTYARLDPHVRRTVANTGSGPATVLICSAPRSSGYEPMRWA
jgi:mannose-6-phosphate isomerase-like protein (cupin superfamily)